MTDPRIIALSSNPGQIEPGPFSEHDLREQWNAQADEFNQWESLDTSEQLAWAQTRAIAADRFLPPVAKPTPVDLAALRDPGFSGGLTPDQHLDVLWGGPDPRVAATTHTIPVAWCRSDDFNDAAQTRQSLVTWREQHSDCDMALYAHPQASPAQSTGPSLEEVGPLVAWLAEAAVQSANAGASKNAGMLTWAAQVIGERVDEDAPDADQAEGPSLDDVYELCAEFEFHLEGDTNESLEALRDMIAAAITRWRAPVAQPVARPVDVANVMRLVEGVDPLAPGEPDVDHILTLAAIIREVSDSHMRAHRAPWLPSTLAEAILSHPDFSGCHDGPAALPAPDHVNLIGFAFGREPWATWLRQGGCLESAHCELSDLMLAVLAKWGRPADLPAQEAGEGLSDQEIIDLADFDAEFDRYDTEDESGNKGVAWECSNSQLLHFARLVRQGRPAALSFAKNNSTQPRGT